MMLFVTILSCLALFSSPLNAQIGELGIYGSVPVAIRNNVQKVRLDTYPESEGLEYILPVNGLKNFNFYYAQSGTGWLPGGGYKISYWNAGLTTSYGTPDIVSYSPNSGHTNGVKVRDFNNPPSDPLGIYATVKVYVPNGGGALTPLKNAVVIITGDDGGNGGILKTNDNGYFSFYYVQVNYNLGSFLTPNTYHYSAQISGSQNGCSYTYQSQGEILWNPTNTGDPTLSSYYVTDARYDVGQGSPVIALSSAQACQP